MTLFVVGITGGIGSGKTTVANLFAAEGIQLVDADVIAREVVAPGQPALAAIKAHFGADILLTDGQLNRSALRQQIFADPQGKTWLNQLLHPLIRQQLLQKLAAARSPYVILVAPLLIENGLQQYVDQLLVVDVSEETQKRRTQQRDQISREQVSSIMAAQCQRAERLQVANQIIQNEGSVLELVPQVERLHQFYLSLAAEKLAKSST